jgi:ubiquinone biosynthesis protein COQ9
MAPERSPERDAAIAAVLDLVPEHGWSITALAAHLPQPDDLAMLFPGGAADLIEAYGDLADRQMEEDAAAADMEGLGLTRRVHKVIALRFARQRPYRDSIRRALAVLALPQNAAVSLRITGRTVGAIWFAAGDRSADFSWYSKRAILAAVYSATLLYWLRDYGLDDGDTLSFLDRRLAGVGRLGRLISRFQPRKSATA